LGASGGCSGSNGSGRRGGCAIGQTVDIDAGTAYNMLVIEAGTANGNAAGNGITLNNASGTHRFDANIGLASSQTWTMAAGGRFDFRGALSDFGANVTLTKAGAGILDLSNNSANTNWLGTLLISEGDVRTSSAANTSIGSGNLTLNGGILYGTNALSMTRPLGADFGQIQITGGTSGFSEDGFGSGTVNFGGAGATVAWGSAHFNPSSLVLLTSGVQSNGPGTIRNAGITFVNGLDLNGANRSVAVDQIDNTILGRGATISGAITNSSGTTGGLIKDGVGRLTLTGTNTYDGGTTINGGTIRFRCWSHGFSRCGSSVMPIHRGACPWVCWP
jgi:fibronectin-binding autotransporter adhesin